MFSFYENVKAERIPFFHIRGEKTFQPTGELSVGFWWSFENKDLRFVSREKNCAARIRLTFEIRSPDLRMTVYKWETTQNFTSDETDCDKERLWYLYRSVRLSPGRYRLTCLVQDEYSGSHFYKEETYHYSDEPVADIRLFTDFNRQFLSVGNELPSRLTVLRYSFPLAPKEKRNLTLKAGLFRKAPESHAEGAIHFLTVQQKNAGLVGGQRTYDDFFNVEGLPPGEYLLEINLYDGVRPAARQIRTFILRSPILWDLKKLSDRHINQLSIIAPSGIITALRKEQNAVKRLEIFNEYWKSRNPDLSPESAAEAFYLTVADADRLFTSGSVAGSETERGKYYIQFGKPDFIRKSGSVEIWTYERYGWETVFGLKSGKKINS